MSVLASFAGRTITDPPPGPVSINRGHPLSQGLMGLWVFTRQGASGPNGGNIRIVDESLGRIPNSCGNTSLGWTQNSHGPALRLAATSDFLAGIISPFHVPADRVTILMIRRKHDTTLRTGVHFGINSGAETCAAFCPFSDGNIYWDFGSGASNRLTVSGLSWNTEVDRLGFVAGTGGMAAYRNGVKVGSQTTAVTRTSGTVAFNLNSGADLVDMNFFAVLNAEWTPSQMLEWMANPYAMLYQPSMIRFALGAAPVSLFTDLAVFGTHKPTNDGKAFAWDADGNVLGSVTPPGA